jgi:purine-binding chemotaxis protein CheW
MASQQILIFKLNNEEFGVNISQIDSIIPPKDIVKVPNTPDYIEGLLSLRGKVYTIFNLRKKFNLPIIENNENTKIVIVNVNSMVVGFIVDEVKEIIKIEDESINENAGTVASLSKKFLAGAAKIDERIILILDLAQTLSLMNDDKTEKAVKVNA